jgi:phosphoribosylanthranilate isomerase
MPFDLAMATHVKICGIKSAPILEASIALGAEYLGFVFYPPSPRSLTPETAKPLAKLAKGRCGLVALLVDADDALIEAVVENVSPDMLQLHGTESPERAAHILARFGVPVMKAIKVETADDARAALAYGGIAERILFDAKAPKDLAGALPGGNGLAFDWRALEGMRGKLDFMLSGGLTPENVAEAVRRTGAWAVDVSSGVESKPGEKDLALIARFIVAAKAA